MFIYPVIIFIFNPSYQLTMINEKYKYSALTEKIIGCAMEVHKILGNGFQGSYLPTRVGNGNESSGTQV